MKEAVGNTLDYLSFSLQFDLDPRDAAKNGQGAGYRYSGLIPQPNAPESSMFKSLPIELFANPSELNIQQGYKNYASDDVLKRYKKQKLKIKELIDKQGGT